MGCGRIWRIFAIKISQYYLVRTNRLSNEFTITYLTMGILPLHGTEFMAVKAVVFFGGNHWIISNGKEWTSRGS